MPVYTYRRQDGTTFELRQKFTDDPLTVDPVTGQPVVRVVQNAGVIFKGSGFYVNDSKSASKSALNASNKDKDAAASTATPAGDAPKAEPAAPAPTATSSAASSAAD